MRLKQLRALAALAGAAAGTALLGGCAMPFARAPIIPPIGWIYEDVSAPLSVNYHHTDVKPAKTGTAQTKYICLWPLIPNSSFAFDDAAIQSAAKAGGINEVAYADYHIFNVLGIYSEFTVTAYGN